MKTNSIFLIILLAVSGVQCSNNQGENDLLSGQGIPDGNISSEGFFTNTIVQIGGYSDETNASFIVTGIDSVRISPEYAYVADWIQGLDNSKKPDSFEVSNTTEVFFDVNSNSFKVRLPPKSIFTLLCISDESKILYLPKWDLTYSFDGSGNLSIKGTGKGSHVTDLYHKDFEAYRDTEITFEFKGNQAYGSDDVKGTFSIIESSPEALSNMAIYGSLTIDFNIFF